MCASGLWVCQVEPNNYQCILINDKRVSLYYQNIWPDKQHLMWDSVGDIQYPDLRTHVRNVWGFVQQGLIPGSQCVVWWEALNGSVLRSVFESVWVVLFELSIKVRQLAEQVRWHGCTVPCWIIPSIGCHCRRIPGVFESNSTCVSLIGGGMCNRVWYLMSYLNWHCGWINV